ncbi:PREDICTED: aquaporin-11-like [Nanorana parkeri]|uniref:aquaporin-11-like n=1 Tax=Nanorana parkeri TaxID=125878 RepID=UPI00085453F2|nr:PREDICTED: aquaporin-11-like [Nanorana parkeri]
MGIMELLLGSAAMIGCTVLLCELLRQVFRRTLPAGLGLELAMEAVSTLQLCCCTRENALLGTRAALQLWLSLTLTYLMTVLHCLTCRTATCNPCGSWDQWLRGLVRGPRILLRVMAQFAGAALSRVLVPRLWALGLSPLHELGEDCESFLHTTLLSGALVEMACSLSLYLVLHLFPPVTAALRPHVVAATITAIVYAGAPLSGAIFNPALAFAVVFLCHGNTYLQYIFVYWIGPLIGTAISFLVLVYILPKFKLSKVSPERVKKD